MESHIHRWVPRIPPLFHLSLWMEIGWCLFNSRKNQLILSSLAAALEESKSRCSHVQAVTVSNKQWPLGRLTKAAIRTGVTDAHHHLDTQFLIIMHYSLWSWDLVKEKKMKMTVKLFVNTSKGKEQVFQCIVGQCTLLSLPDFSKGMKSSKNGILFISKPGKNIKRKCSHIHIDRI